MYINPKAFIIAEIGVNHDGSVTKAMRLIDAAKAAGADAAKFQLFDSVELFGDNRISNLQLTQQELYKLADHCVATKIEFMCTPFSASAVQFLAPMVQRMKIASGCITRRPLLEAVRNTKKPVLLSTGMATYADIREALSRLGASDVTLLHCTSAYPCPLDQVNLRAMKAMRMLGRDTGYSDHTEGIIVSLAAVAAGATVIEKHITLNRHAKGPDHKASIEPSQFQEMVRGIRQIEIALGTNAKTVQPSEMPAYQLWRACD